jgi:hypothetical protein
MQEDVVVRPPTPEQHCDKPGMVPQRAIELQSLMPVRATQQHSNAQCSQQLACCQLLSVERLAAQGAVALYAVRMLSPPPPSPGFVAWRCSVAGQCLLINRFVYPHLVLGTRSLILSCSHVLRRTWLISTPRSLVEGWLGGVSRASSTTVLSPACKNNNSNQISALLVYMQHTDTTAQQNLPPAVGPAGEGAGWCICVHRCPPAAARCLAE